MLALRHTRWVYVSALALCVNNAGLFEALRNSWLLLRGSVSHFLVAALLEVASVTLGQLSSAAIAPLG